MVLDLDSIVSEAWRQAGRHFEAVREYPYHNRSHTERTLARAMYLAEREGVDELTRAEIAIATIFHDTGFSRVYDHNEPIWAGYARDFAMAAGLGSESAERVGSLVLATALGSDAPTLAHAIVQDADLDNLGLESWVMETMAIHHEMTMFSDSEESWREWLEKSVRLFERHVFVTATARAERQETQAKNAKILATMLQIEREHPSSRLS